MSDLVLLEDGDSALLEFGGLLLLESAITEPTVIRQHPPLRLHYDIQTPSGKHYRWGTDEADPADVPNGARFADSMPGGFESLDLTLPRKPGTDYPDLDRLSTIRALGAGGDVVWEGRLERAPRASGDEMAISPSAVGWQAHLEDDKSAQGIYVGRELDAWQSVSRSRRITLLGSYDKVFDPSVDTDATDALPSVILTLTGTFPNDAICEAWLDGGPLGIARTDYAFESHDIAATDNGYLGVADDDKATNAEYSADFVDAANDSGSGSFVATTARRWATMRHIRPGSFATASDRVISIRPVVFGAHGLTVRGVAPDTGLYASDVIAHAVGTWAPHLTYTEGSEGSVTPTSFVIPHIAFAEPTTVAEIITQANRFHLRDWAVWEDRTFYYHDRGARGRKWRARVAPAQLEETGPQIDRLWNGIIVSYSDVDGKTFTVGPPDSNADATDDQLVDADPENPANQLGIRRWDLLSVSGTTTQAGAIEIGARFLAESKLLDTSGRAQFVGVVEDDRGISRPYYQPRAGDYVSFVDSADTSYRRIVRTEKDVATRTCSVDLDAPPEGLDALLERLGAVLVPLGL